MICYICITRFTFATIEGLSPCKDYQFRVTAENFYGRSEPCEPTNVFKTETVEEGRKRKGLPVEGSSPQTNKCYTYRRLSPFVGHVSRHIASTLVSSRGFYANI